MKTISRRNLIGAALACGLAAGLMGATKAHAQNDDPIGNEYRLTLFPYHKINEAERIPWLPSCPLFNLAELDTENQTNKPKLFAAGRSDRLIDRRLQFHSHARGQGSGGRGVERPARDPVNGAAGATDANLRIQPLGAGLCGTP